MSDSAPVVSDAAPAELPKDVSNAPNQPKSEVKKFKIGDMEFDENSARSEIERGRQSGRLLTEAQKRLEASSKKEKELANRFNLKGKDHNAVAKALLDSGLSRDEVVDLMGKYIYENEIAPKEMSPEQQELRKLKAEMKALSDEKSAKEQTEKDAAFQQKVQQEIANLKAELEPILAEKKIPNTRVALKRMALMMQSYEQAGVKIPAARAVDMLMADYQTEFGELLDGANPDQLEAFLGKERMTKLARSISQWALAKSKARVPADTIDPVQKAKSPDTKKMSPSQFTKFIGGM